MDPIDENPFVAVVAKKCRNLKKKLDRIQKCEQDQLSGKSLDEDQLKLLASKSSIEKAYTELDAIKLQLDEVAKEQNKAAVTPKSKAVVETSTASSQSEMVGVDNKETMTETTSSQTVPPPPPVSDSKPEETTVTSTQTLSETPVSPTINMDDAIKKFLKVIHVYTNYSRITNKKLSALVDYFGKTLLGQTSIAGTTPTFISTLNTSSQSALLYLNENEASKEEVISGTTYQDMSNLIDQLAIEMDACISNTSAHYYRTTSNVSTTNTKGDKVIPTITTTASNDSLAEGDGPQTWRDVHDKDDKTEKPHHKTATSSAGTMKGKETTKKDRTVHPASTTTTTTAHTTSADTKPHASTEVKSTRDKSPVKKVTSHSVSTTQSQVHVPSKHATTDESKIHDTDGTESHDIKSVVKKSTRSAPRVPYNRNKVPHSKSDMSDSSDIPGEQSVSADSSHTHHEGDTSNTTISSPPHTRSKYTSGGRSGPRPVRYRVASQPHITTETTTSNENIDTSNVGNTGHSSIEKKDGDDGGEWKPSRAPRKTYDSADRDSKPRPRTNYSGVRSSGYGRPPRTNVTVGEHGEASAHTTTEHPEKSNEHKAESTRPNRPYASGGRSSSYGRGSGGSAAGRGTYRPRPPSDTKPQQPVTTANA